MDPKIRIFFFPRDASRIRTIVFSRKVGFAAMLVALPLCLLGFWLALGGQLRESPERKFERVKLERETEALSARTAVLQEEIASLRRNLDSLESVRISVALSSGLTEADAEDPVDDRAGRFLRIPGFGGGGADGRGDFSAPLARARAISQTLDSTLFVLSRDANLAARLPTLWPVSATSVVTRGFGQARDPFTGRMSLHPGVDFSLPPGSPVVAVGGGTVVAAGNDPVWGWHVRIRHTEHAETFYAHLQGVDVRAGRTVARGQVIGTVGQSGASTGPHLHFEMRLRGDRVDPMPYLSPGKN